MLNLFILMHADDTVLFSEDTVDLQNMITCIQRYSNKGNLNVNVDKTKIVVFRKCRRLVDNVRNGILTNNPSRLLNNSVIWALHLTRDIN